MQDRLPQKILESVATLTLLPLPQALVSFLVLAEEDNPSMQDLAALVALDPAFTANILTIAASPPYNQETTPIRLEKSMASLGLPLLRTLASCLVVQNSRMQAIYKSNLDYPGFWCHSLRVAALARSLAQAVGYPDHEEAYLSGLQHDIGHLLLVGGVIEFCSPSPGTSSRERDIFGLTQNLSGVDLAALGARLVESWRFSSFMSAAVQFHEFPEGQIRSADMLCRIVWSAHRLSGSAGELLSSDDLLPEAPQIPALLGIDPAAVSKACYVSRSWAEERAACYGLQKQMTETFLPDRKHIYPYLSALKSDFRDADQLRLEAMIRTQAVMQPLQQSLASISREADLIASLSAAARLLFGLQRPVFLLPLADRPLLVAAGGAGDPPLLSRMEIPFEPDQSLAAAALMAQRPRSSFDGEGNRASSLFDILLIRLLGSEGLLCIPMGTSAQPIGVMVFGLTAEQYACKLRVLEWMTGFAHSAAGCLASFRSIQQRDQLIAGELSRRLEQKVRKVVHEAANPLGIIKSYLNIFAGKLEDGAEAQQELNILKEEISRVERIIRRLNDQPEQPLSVESVNVNTLVEGMLVLYGESLFAARKIEVDTQLASGLPPVRADRDSLKQIFLNLWKNSAEAMPTGGSYLVSTRFTGQGSADCRVEIRLGDSGPGIPADVRERLFQPLAPDRCPANSGVGLSIVASLVERLGGEISCDSTPQGTTFTICLALAQKETA